jgi:hypothetical protein
MAAPISSANYFALGRRTGILLVTNQICVVGDDGSCSGYGLGSTHVVMILEEAMVDSIDVVTSEVTSEVTREVDFTDAVTSAVTSEVTTWQPLPP